MSVKPVVGRATTIFSTLRGVGVAGTGVGAGGGVAVGAAALAAAAAVGLGAAGGAAGAQAASNRPATASAVSSPVSFLIILLPPLHSWQKPNPGVLSFLLHLAGKAVVHHLGKGYVLLDARTL